MKSTKINLIRLICIGLILIIPSAMSMKTPILTKEEILTIFTIFYSNIKNHLEHEDKDGEEVIKNVTDVILKLKQEFTSEEQLLEFLTSAMKNYLQPIRPPSLTDQVLSLAVADTLNEYKNIDSFCQPSLENSPRLIRRHSL